MSEDPVVDGRRREKLRTHAESLAPYYTESWDPNSDDFGAAMIALFADLASEVTERLDRVPEKHRVGFFDSLGFTRRPPQSARLPLTFAVDNDLGENVAIPAQTRAVASAVDARPEQTFQIPADGGFEATPSAVDLAYSVDPLGDRIFDARSAAVDHEDAVIFGGEDHQRHELYIGDADGLRVDPGSTIGVAIETVAAVDVLKDRLVWEYYGEKARDGETIEDWHSFEGRFVGDDRGNVVRIDLRLPASGTLTETEVDGVETHWIRCRLPGGVPPTSPFDLTIASVAVGPVQSPVGSPPKAMRYNDVPLPVEINGEGVLPFGESPQRLDAFYVASSEAFSKRDERVELRFDAVSDIDTSVTDPRLSWEYWNGTSWTRIAEVGDTTNRLRTDGAVAFPIPSDLSPTTVAGQESHWIRVRLAGGHYGTPKFEPNDDGTWSQVDDVTPPRFESVTISFDPAAPPLGRPERLIAHNNLAFGENLTERGSGSFRPFTGLPDTTQTFYLGFDGPLRDGPINLLFELADVEYPSAFYPRIRWEYCRAPDRDEWARLDATDETESLTRRGIVGLGFPEETVAFERFGRTRHWIRARVTGDEFTPAPVRTSTETEAIVVSQIYPVRELVEITNRSDAAIDLTGYRIDFEYNQPTVQIRAFPEGTTLQAGESLLVATGTKSIGPADLRFDYRRHVLNRGDPDVVAILAPDDGPIDRQTYRPRTEIAPIRPGSVLADRLEAGREAERRGTTPSVSSMTPFVDEMEATRGDQAPCPPACLETFTTVPPTGRPERTAPRLYGLYPNAGWTYNVRPIEDEIVGSSDGAPGQTFTVSSPPIIEGEVWIDERTALSEGARERLEGDPAVETKRVNGRGDELEAFWVRWRQVDDFLETGDDDRVYALDPTVGELTFGDGVGGRIPPRGRDNVTVTYRTGGGEAGNVERGTVTDLSSSIPFVDEVSNPLPGDGGTDAESMNDVLSRAPRELRDRGRAVTVADVERVASASSRKLARTKCISGMNEDGGRAPGWVTLVIVPREQQRRPVPSTETKQQVRAAMRQRAPATLFEPDRLVVRGPSYVEVTVDTTLAAGVVESIAVLEARATAALEGFLHPLTGRASGEGWAFGTVPCLSDVYALLEGIDGVDHVEDLSVTIAGNDTDASLTAGQPAPTVSPDTLVFSGTHEVAARGGR